ncbi:MAG: hypothetical protein KA323_14300, partial [Planctomycetes bacterium]|nr:hypothetical protein [Planctomycetota bacterium]
PIPRPSPLIPRTPYGSPVRRSPYCPVPNNLGIPASNNPGLSRWAKSAGTIIAMAGDEILIEFASALGPIDAQMTWQGKVFSADALLKGMEKIKREVDATGTLNRAYIPMLQALSPGELESAKNALDFAKKLVSDWLVKYKFKNWRTHSRSGKTVTKAEKRARASEIAGKPCNHKKWLTHGRSRPWRIRRGGALRNPRLAPSCVIMTRCPATTSRSSIVEPLFGRPPGPFAERER